MYDDMTVASNPKKVENSQTASMTEEMWSEWWLQRLYELGKVLYERCEEEIEPYHPHKRVTGLPDDPLGG